MPVDAMKPILPALVLLPFMAAAGDLFPNGKSIEGTVESLTSSDIEVFSGNLAFIGENDPWKTEARVLWNDYGLDYSPILFGTNESLSESTLLANLAITREWSPEWESTLILRAYDGFAEYRSIWIAEYYRQLFGGFAEYENPDPHGQAIGATVRWDYTRGGSATASFNFGRDTIAPGWDFNGITGTPEAGRETLDTIGGGLLIEQAVLPWLKTELDLTVRETTDRDARFGIRNDWAAVWDDFVFRAIIGHSRESPSFDATFGSFLCEWNFHPQWYLHAGYRQYRDSGEIEASGFNSLAPALDSSEWFAGLLWDRGDLSIGGGIGFLEADYAALDANNQFFGNLYKDRDWVTVRLSASYTF